ncbi:hypothetical protein RFI_35850 [Reticulomyxa filosa]|uniref:Uncharacterized protein n=1 Tax=Reticulomyxa filosa TaxID=46433 RepID=X6LLI3_RETFI|nr:hypothetical protein RFI_35850 [Reticulomyxa filosa]|eukprot:ETO01590.1 hypothetical protein RFI_35850 [Reticulomyxa filosa]
MQKKKKKKNKATMKRDREYFPVSGNGLGFILEVLVLWPAIGMICSYCLEWQGGYWSQIARTRHDDFTLRTIQSWMSIFICIWIMSPFIFKRNMIYFSALTVCIVMGHLIQEMKKAMLSNALTTLIFVASACFITLCLNTLHLLYPFVYFGTILPIPFRYVTRHLEYLPDYYLSPTYMWLLCKTLFYMLTFFFFFFLKFYLHGII